MNASFEAPDGFPLDTKVRLARVLASELDQIEDKMHNALGVPKFFTDDDDQDGFETLHQIGKRKRDLRQWLSEPAGRETVRQLIRKKLHGAIVNNRNEDLHVYAGTILDSLDEVGWPSELAVAMAIKTLVSENRFVPAPVEVGKAVLKAEGFLHDMLARYVAVEEQLMERLEA